MTILENMLVGYARHFPLQRGKLRLVNALWRYAAGGNFTREARLRHGGFKVPCDLTEMLQRQFYYFGTYFLEDQILSCWEREARTSETIFDIGANAGIFSLAALAVKPDARVFAFEPTPEIANRLRAAVKINGLRNLIVNEMAVGDHDGQAVLRRWRGVDNSNEGMNFITSEEGVGEAVRLVSLDQYCQDNAIERIDLLKIDIQGNEPLAFSGAARLLREGRIRTIFAELNWNATGDGGPAAQMISSLAAANFRFSDPHDRTRWREAGDWMHGRSDIVAQVAA
jgi:FkbM family methyltransferase